MDYKKNICPRDIITKDAIMNALTVDMALGCSTNSMLHIPAIAHEIGFDFDIAMANEVSARTPNLCHLAPAGPTYMEDLNEAGGVYAVINQLCEAGLINEDCMTVTGKTIGEAVKGHKNLNPEVIRPMANPYSSTGGLAVLKGNIAPDGSVVKRSAVVPEMLQHEGPARVFECEEDAIAAIKGGKIVEGDVVVIRYEGPKGGPGMREMLNPTSAIAGMGLGSSVALITDGRFSVVDASGGSTPSATLPLVMASKYFKDKRYLASAKRTVDYLEKELISKADYFSSTLDANCEDKEASLYAATAAYYLALVTKGEERAHYCRSGKESRLFCLVMVLYLGCSFCRRSDAGRYRLENPWLGKCVGRE